MALELSDLIVHCRLQGSPDAADAHQLQRLLDAATAHIERLLGFSFTNTDELPSGAPADLELAVLQLAADWYENREATLVGVTGRPIPFGVQEIVNEYRRYTFGVLSDG